jgi:F-type H+-transporting ATPase subunit delta
MFFSQPWALGFIHAAPDTAAAARGLEFIRALSPVFRSVRGNLSGTAAALQLETMVRASFAAASPAGMPVPMPRAEELALCLMLLLIKKNQFKHIGQVTGAIERELDKLQGILQVRLESAGMVEKEFQEVLTQALIKKTGAAGVKLDTVVTPELLAGYRLRIGSQVIEASLRLHLRQLQAELAETYAGSGAAQGGL